MPAHLCLSKLHVITLCECVCTGFGTTFLTTFLSSSSGHVRHLFLFRLSNSSNAAHRLNSRSSLRSRSEVGVIESVSSSSPNRAEKPANWNLNIGVGNGLGGNYDIKTLELPVFASNHVRKHR